MSIYSVFWAICGIFPLVTASFLLSQPAKSIFIGNYTTDCERNVTAISTLMIFLFFARTYIFIYMHFSKAIKERIEDYNRDRETNKGAIWWIEILSYLPCHYEKIPWHTDMANLLIRICVIILLIAVCAVVATTFPISITLHCDMDYSLRIVSVLASAFDLIMTGFMFVVCVILVLASDSLT